MSNRCSGADCKYPDCTCWEDKYSQSVERIVELEQELAIGVNVIRDYEQRIAELEEIERRWNNIQPRHVIMIGDTGHYVNTAVHDRIAELEAERDAAFNKGMERAEEIAWQVHTERDYVRTAYEAAVAIRKEIDND